MTSLERLRENVSQIDSLIAVPPTGENVVGDYVLPILKETVEGLVDLYEAIAAITEEYGDEEGEEDEEYEEIEPEKVWISIGSYRAVSQVLQTLISDSQVSREIKEKSIEAYIAVLSDVTGKNRDELLEDLTTLKKQNEVSDGSQTGA